MNSGYETYPQLDNQSCCLHPANKMLRSWPKYAKSMFSKASCIRTCTIHGITSLKNAYKAGPNLCHPVLYLQHKLQFFLTSYRILEAFIISLANILRNMFKRGESIFFYILTKVNCRQNKYPAVCEICLKGQQREMVYCLIHPIKCREKES